MSKMMDLTNKLYVVTGASAGLGRQLSITLSELGAKVILVARNEEKMKQTIDAMEGKEHDIYLYDFTSVEGIETLVTQIVKKHGKVDGMVHCAGIGDLRPLAQSTYPFMLQMLNVHAFSFVELVRVFSKKKNCNEGASMIAISSAGTINADKGKTAYNMAKTALEGAIKPMAIELGTSRKIRVNAVRPGWIKTDMYYQYIDLFGHEESLKTEKKHFLGCAESYEIAEVIAFLLSDQSRQITGQSITVDGGWTLW